MYFVYVIKSKKDNKHYAGITDNLSRRLKEHNRGKSSTPSTKNRGPFELIYFEKIEDRLSARKREKYFKTAAGRRFLKKKNKHSGVAQW